MKSKNNTEELTPEEMHAMAMSMALAMRSTAHAEGKHISLGTLLSIIPLAVTVLVSSILRELEEDSTHHTPVKGEAE